MKYRSNKTLYHCIETSWHAFDKYYSLSDRVAAYGTALLLAPHRRLAYISRNWKPSWKRGVLAAATDLWAEYKGIEVEGEMLACTQQEGEEVLDEFDKYMQQQATLTLDRDEFDHFINGVPIKLPSGVSSLDWWLQEVNRAAYPSLSRLAIDLLSIPPMSAEPERIFSGARRTISWDRFRLGHHNIERLECMKSWIRTGIASAWRAETGGKPGEPQQQQQQDKDSNASTPTGAS